MSMSIGVLKMCLYIVFVFIQCFIAVYRQTRKCLGDSVT